MDIQSLKLILARLERDEAWQEQHLFQRLCSSWKSIVGSDVAAHSRPSGIHRGTLQVSTSSSVWSHHLSFERRRILQKIQRSQPLQQLELREIRFSTLHWRISAIPLRDRLGSHEQGRIWQAHPSRLDGANKPCPCPRCQSPTPPGELRRWSVCAFCMAPRWRAEQLHNQQLSSSRSSSLS